MSKENLEKEFEIVPCIADKYSETQSAIVVNVS